MQSSRLSFCTGASTTRLSAIIPAGQKASDKPLSKKEKLLQQGMELLSKYQESQKASQASNATVAFPRSSVPVPPEGQDSSAGQASEKDQLIQQGLALLTKYRETEKK